MVSGPNPPGVVAPPPVPTYPPAPVDLAVTYDRYSGEMVLDNQSPTQQYSNVHYDTANQQWYFDPGTVPTDWGQVGTNALIPLKTVGEVVKVAVQHGIIGDVVGYTFDAFGNVSVIPAAGDALGSVGNTLGNLADQVPGEGWILKMINAMYNLPQDISTLVTAAEQMHPMQYIQAMVPFTGILGDLIQNKGAELFQFMADHTVGEFYSGMLNIGLEVDTSKFDDQAKQGLKVVDTMLGFAFLLEFAVAALDFEGKGVLAGRWAESLKDTVAKIPEELGISWVLGTAIEQGFETAVGESIREGINRQKRGNRIAWQQLRVLLKQHVLTPERLQTLLENQGFPDEQIEWLRQLADITIPVGDISQLYYREKIDETEAKKLIGELGFNDRDTQHILELYVTKAETQASVTYRSIAKQMYVNHLLSETQYRAILTESNFPSRMIDADIAGISLEQTVGHVLETVALVKTEYLHKRIDPAEATRRLALLNYAPSYITDLIASWDLPAIKAKHGLSTAKVLSYMISGLLTPDQARPMLQANGVDDTTVEFLLLHPTANTGAKQHALSPGLVTQAYMDGAVSLSDLAAAYKRAGVPDSSLDYYLNIAKYKFSHKRGNAGYTQTLGTGDYKSAYKYGLLDFPGLVTSLESIGWRPDDALLLAEIENKGPYQPAQPPAFATLSAALAYLQQAGFTLHTPTDPRLLAAENMAAVAGYTWSPPPTPVGGSEVLPPVTDPGPGTQTGGFTPP